MILSAWPRSKEKEVITLCSFDIRYKGNNIPFIKDGMLMIQGDTIWYIMIQYDYDIKCTCLEEPKRLKFDLDLSPDVPSTSCSLTNYCRVKTFSKTMVRKLYKVWRACQNFKNRFNINLGQLPVFKQAIGQ